MKSVVSPTLITQKILSVILIFAGVTLLTYMVIVEGEPGALPLLVLITGTAWLLINQYRIKKQMRKS